NEIYEICLRTNEWTRITRSPEDEHGPDYSPDGNLMVFIRGNRQLVIRNMSDGKERVVIDALIVRYPYWGSYYWSPDGKWLAVTLSDEAYSDEIYILPVNEDDSEGELVNITRHHDNDYLMGWSDDGEHIYFVSNRHAQLGLGTYGSWRADTGVYTIPLKRTPPPRSDVLEFPPIEPDDAPDETNGEESENENGDENESEKAEPEAIHFDRIAERARLVSPTRGTGWAASLSPDGSTFVYVSDALGSNALWSVPFQGGSATRLTDCGTAYYIQWTPDSKGFYFLDRNRVKYCTKGGSVSNVTTSGRLTVDLTAERLQMIYEAGRILKNSFYDADMHGVDWDAMVEYYAPLVLESAVPEDFELVMSMLFGELAASHLGFYADTSSEGISFDPGWLGLDFDPATSGKGLLVTKVWPRGPADYPEIDIFEGDWVMKINGADVSTSVSYSQFLDDTFARTTVLEVASDQFGTNSREIVIGPMSGSAGYPYGTYSAALYLDWTESKRAIVDELTRGRIGYIHLPHMMGEPLERFARELFAENFDKDALIIDVRWNSGGNIHEALFDILSRRQFGWSRNRDEDNRIGQPSRRFDQPIVVLINERSFSDAEIFPEGIRALGLATLIGETTSGGVIGTANITLVDGSTSMRVPRVGWFTLDGRNMENFGVEPDIRVINDLDDVWNGIDCQLLKAIEFLSHEIGMSVRIP
ncbi:MAG TPA: hypothetical protein ENN67_07330, partial [Firmicutes bacterium]|nr:hypothetical protein [Bacillota bacterium]